MQRSFAENAGPGRRHASSGSPRQARAVMVEVSSAAEPRCRVKSSVAHAARRARNALPRESGGPRISARRAWRWSGLAYSSLERLNRTPVMPTLPDSQQKGGGQSVQQSPPACSQPRTWMRAICQRLEPARACRSRGTPFVVIIFPGHVTQSQFDRTARRDRERRSVARAAAGDAIPAAVPSCSPVSGPHERPAHTCRGSATSQW